MVAAVSSIHESDNHGQALLNEVVQLFTDLLNASGASIPMIRTAMESALHSSSREYCFNEIYGPWLTTA